jgi:putative CocE/NonD family hydrolase
MRRITGWAVALAALSLAHLAAAQGDATMVPPPGGDIPAKVEAPTAANDYVKRVVMIPMRDGAKLYTVIVVPKGATHAPILLTRTPYNAAKRADRNPSPHAEAIVAQSDELFIDDGYIRVFQDVRGKYGSEGEYVMTRPLIGPLNPTKVDHTTDTWDTIDWLVKNVPETNGKVGMIGSSYEGFTVLMGLVNPHPALKAAVPQSPMVDGWMGDDWYHYGAFREINLGYFTGQMSKRGAGDPIATGTYDDYSAYLNAGSAGDFAEKAGLGQFPFWKRFSAHPAYDAFWQTQAMDKILGKGELKVPTMLVVGAWDQEDIWGAPHVWAALKPKDVNNDKLFMVIGPWRHSGVNYEGRNLGVVKFEGDTALQFRRDVEKPFLDQYLKDGAPKAVTPTAFIYDTGTNQWKRLPAWPVSCEKACVSTTKPIYLQPGFGLSFNKPAKGAAAYDEYVSDPAKPVPFVQRPVRMGDRDVWTTWLVSDQRHAAARTDVLSYVTPPLTAPVQIAGSPLVNLIASTTGTDGDFVVKLIDVYPDEVPSQPEMGGYQLMVTADIFRGRYRESFEHPKAIKPNAPLDYRFALPEALHTFLPGHRIMVQIQSSWFPLYDRNPQTFVDNILFAKPADYVKATERVWRAPDKASFVELPVVDRR